MLTKRLLSAHDKTSSMGRIKRAVIIIFLILSFFFIMLNFAFPHTISVNKIIVSPQQVVVVSNSTLLNHQQELFLNNNSYQYLPV